MYKLIVVFCGLLLYFVSARSQSVITLGGIAYKIPSFKEDSTLTYDDWFVKNGIVGSIKKSAFDLEIRAFYKPWFMSDRDEGYCLVIKGNRDSLIADYYMVAKRFRVQNIQGAIMYSKRSYPDFDMMLAHLHIDSQKRLDTLLRKLLAGYITNIPDYNILLKQFEHSGTKLREWEISDCCVVPTYEIKVGKQIRNFTTYSFYYDANRDNKELMKEKNLDDIIWNFERPLLYPNH